jgi:hypothetical protein
MVTSVAKAVPMEVACSQPALAVRTDTSATKGRSAHPRAKPPTIAVAWTRTAARMRLAPILLASLLTLFHTTNSRSILVLRERERQRLLQPPLLRSPWRSLQLQALRRTIRQLL